MCNRQTQSWFAPLGALLLAVAVLGGCSDDESPSGCTTDDECRAGRACIAGSCQEPPDVGSPDVPDPDATPDAAPDIVDEPDAGEDVPDVPDVQDVAVDADDASDADAMDAADTGDADVEEDVPDLPDTPGALSIDPESIDFGEVGLFVSEFREITLRNTGGGDLVVRNVRLQTPDSAGFQLIAPTRLPLTLGGGQSAVWQVRFQPTQLRGDRPTRYGNFVLIASSDAEDEAEIPMEGLATPAPTTCLTFDQRAVDLGYVSPNNVQSARLALRNCGTEAAEVDSVEVQDVPETLITLGTQTPISLGPGEEVAVVITYTPSVVREVRGRLVATAGNTEAVVEVRSGPECPTAAAVAQAGEEEGERLSVLRGASVSLNGESSTDPTQGELTYRWTIAGPEGSVELAVDPGLDVGVLSFVPDVAGTYRATLRVTSSLSGLESCNEAVVFIDTFPETPQVDISVTWNNRADLDLHMVREVDGRFPAFGAGQQVQANDCYFNNLNPNWGRGDSRVDDPRLLGDDTDGEGPERILYPQLDPSRRLRVGINYARRRETESVEATVVVRVDGEEAGRYTQTLTEQGAYWIPVIIAGDGTLTEP